ncbi:MAG: VWA domain-containing protein [Planctomycetota bacterium]|nr:VWA domain-containing protein [Planctomycetota bacterium]
MSGPEPPPDRLERRRRSLLLLFLLLGFPAIPLLVLWRGPNGAPPVAAPASSDVQASPRAKLTAENELLQRLRLLRDELERPGLSLDEAARNLGSAGAVYEFARDEVVYLPYSQAFADPEGVLRTRVANCFDRARLLAALLEKLGYEARLRTAPWPAEARPHPGGFPPRPPSYDSFMDFIGLDDSGVEADLRKQAESLREASEEIAAECDASVEALGALVSAAELDRMPEFANPRDDTWVWVEARQGEGAWTSYDPTFPDAARPPSHEPIVAAASHATISLSGVYSDGGEEPLLSFAGPAVGWDAELFFLPADRAPSKLPELDDPREVRAWLPMLQVGPANVKGRAFTPEGALLADLRGRPAAELDAQGDLALEAVPVEDLKVVALDAAAFPRVRATLEARTRREPRWHARHFALRDAGEAANVRIAAQRAAPLPVVVVLDTSESMKNQGRLDLAKQAVVELLDRLPEGLPVAVLHYFNSVRVAVPAAPLAANRDFAKGQVRGLNAFGGTPLVESLEQALKAVEGPAWVVVLSDGFDSTKTQPDYAAREARALERIRASGKTFLTLSIGEADQSLLSAVARASGGAYYPVTDAKNLPRLFERLSTAIGGRIVLEYDLPADAKAGGPREVTVALQGYEGEASGAYTPPARPAAPRTLRKLALTVRMGDGAYPWHGSTRTIALFDGEYQGWELLRRTSLWVTPGWLPPHVLAARRLDRWIGLLERQLVADGGPLSELHFNRAMSFRQAWTTNAFATLLSSHVREGVHWHLTPSIYAEQQAFFRRGKDIVERRSLDWLGQMDPPSADSSRQAARFVAGWSAAEGRILGAPSAHAPLLEARKALVLAREPGKLPPELDRTLQPTAERYALVDPQRPDFAWLYYPRAGSLYAFDLRSPGLAKGARAERIAAEFDALHEKLGNFGYIAYMLLAAGGSPAGAMYAGLAAFFDQVLSLYCYAAVMMNQLAEGIERGAFDEGAAREEARLRCKTGGSADEFVRRIVSNAAKEFTRSTIEGIVALGLGVKTRDWLGSVPAPGFVTATDAIYSGGASYVDDALKNPNLPDSIKALGSQPYVDRVEDLVKEYLDLDPWRPR